MSALQTSVLKTLALFAAQDEAATLMELQSLLVRVAPDQSQASLSDIREVLEGPLGSQVASGNGLFTLKGHESSFELRLARYNASLALFRRARQYTRFLRYLPYVRAAAISGSAAQLNAGQHSDIDLFIIAQPGRIFLARLAVSAYFQALGLRRHGDKIAGRFCLNHYVAADLKMLQDCNLYTALLYTSFLPLFGQPYFERFWRANLHWIKTFFVSPHLPRTHVFAPQDSPPWLQKILEILLLPVAPLFEKIVRHLQARRIKTSEYVIVSDEQLAFHPGSRGQQILARYEAVLGEKGFPARA